MHDLKTATIQTDVDEELFEQFRAGTRGLTGREAVERALQLWVILENPEEMVEDVIE